MNIRVAQSGDTIPLQIDDGVQFGRGVFETLRVLEEPVFLEVHLDRMNAGLARLDLPVTVTPGPLRDALKRHRVRQCALKILATRDNLLLLTRPLPYTDTMYREGIRLLPEPRLRGSTDPLLSVKSLNYLGHLLAREQAMRQGFSDALWVDEDGGISETTSANLFFVRNGVLHTPDADSGLLPGIIRNRVLEQNTVRTGRYTLEELLSADEWLITNSLAGVLPVTGIGDNHVPAGPVTRLLIAAYRDAIRRFDRPESGQLS